MSFIENITALLGISEICPPSYKCVILGDSGAYFEGVERVESITSQKIILKLKMGKIAVEGENLRLSKYCESDVGIKGTILKTERLK